MTLFRVPDLGEGLHEIQIVAWHVGEGDHVVADQPLVSVETDKAVVEIPAPYAGRVARCFGEPGDVVAIGAPLVEIGELGGVDAGTVVGEVPGAAAPPPPAPSAPAPAAPALDSAPTASHAASATPVVRRLAEQLGVDLATIAGSGPAGAVTRADVERAAAASTAPGEAGVELLRGVRRAMADNMTRAHAQVVPATVTDDADIGAWGSGSDHMVRLVRAVVVGCASEPALNAWYLGPDRGRVRHRAVHLGVAMDAPDGLFVPVLRDAGDLGPAAVRDALDAFERTVTDRTIAPEALRGQTITLSNFGSVAGRYGALVVVPPQVAILGAGHAADRVVARAGVAVVRPLLPLSLTFDHRVVTGGEAARFLAAVRADLERPA